MTSWVAICFGALDLRGHELSSEGAEYVAIPTIPATPLLLQGTGARLWRKLVDGPVDDSKFTPEENVIVLEMEEVGLASRDTEHRARIHRVERPWLVSPVHELVYSLLCHVAEQIDADVVFIKGPTLHAQGLRDRQHSGDVDCWISPGHEKRLAYAMRPWGWIPAISAFTGTPVLHSLTLRPGSWGCAIDVHTWFPGMTVKPATAFAYVLNTAENRSFAGRSLRTPAIGVHAVVAALHEVRPINGQSPSQFQVQAAIRALRAAGTHVLTAVNRLGAEYALRETLRSAFPMVAFESGEVAVPADWAWRLRKSPFHVYREAFRIIGWRDRPRVLLRLVWPSTRDLRTMVASQDEPTNDFALRLHHLQKLLGRVVQSVSTTLSGKR